MGKWLLNIYIYRIYMYKPLLINVSVSLIVSGVQPHMTLPFTLEPHRYTGMSMLIEHTASLEVTISKNSRKMYVADLANHIHCNFPPEAMMNTVSSYEAAYWLERISYNFLICFAPMSKMKNDVQTE